MKARVKDQQIFSIKGQEISILGFAIREFCHQCSALPL